MKGYKNNTDNGYSNKNVNGKAKVKVKVKTKANVKVKVKTKVNVKAKTKRKDENESVSEIERNMPPTIFIQYDRRLRKSGEREYLEISWNKLVLTGD